MVKLFKKSTKYISADHARALFLSGQMETLQVGQWIRCHKGGPCSRILRHDKERGNIQIHPNRGVGTVAQRFLRAHGLKKAGVLDIVEPQSVALAVEKCTEANLNKMRATVSIMIRRIEELEKRGEALKTA